MINKLRGVVGWVWDGHRWDGSHRFQCKMNSSHQNPTTYKIWSYSTKMPQFKKSRCPQTCIQESHNLSLRYATSLKVTQPFTSIPLQKQQQHLYQYQHKHQRVISFNFQRGQEKVSCLVLDKGKF